MLLIWASLALFASALHLKDGVGDAPGLLSLDNGVALPPVSEFRELWTAKSLVERRKPTFPADIQLVLGVFSTQNVSERGDVHSVIKETWMSQPGVCWLNEGQRDSCGVYVAFVLGKREPPEYRVDELVLNTSENMNMGKSFDFFSHVAFTHPWATHIAKMDLDTFPYLKTLMLSLHWSSNGQCEHFVGTPVDFFGCGSLKSICPPRGCGNPMDLNFLHFKNKTIPGCWAYMQGGFYALSADLARAVAAPGGSWSKHKVGHEDLITGKMVSHYARSQGICVRGWDPLAWDHVASRRQDVWKQWGD